jgi:hypothetical protein
MVVTLAPLGHAQPEAIIAGLTLTPTLTRALTPTLTLTRPSSLTSRASITTTPSSAGSCP